MRTKSQRVRDQLPNCTCACGCRYPLMSTISKEALKCFECRHDTHIGGTPLLPQR